MTWDLGTLILSSTVDLSGAKTDLNKFKDYVKQQTLDLSGYSNSIQALTKQINGAKITPQVDMSQLHELNKLYKIKKDDHDDLAGHVKRNPIKPIVDGSQLVEAIAQTQALKKELLSLKSVTSHDVSVFVQHEIDGSRFIEAFEKAGDKVADKIAKKIGETKVKASGSSGFLGNVVAGVTQGFFAPIAKPFGQGVQQSLDAAISSKVGSLELLGKKLPGAIGEILSSTFNSASKEFPLIKGARAIALTAVGRLNPFLQAITELIGDDLEKDTERLAQRAKNEARSKRQSSQALKGAVSETRELSRDYFSGLNDKVSLSSIDNGLGRQEQRLSSLAAAYRKSVASMKLTDPAFEGQIAALEEINTALETIFEVRDRIKNQSQAIEDEVKILKEKRAKAIELVSSLQPERPSEALSYLLKQLGAEVSPENIPKVVDADATLKKKGGLGAYEASSNLLFLQKSVREKLDKIHELSFQELSNLVHELQHGIDLEFGSAKGIIADQEGKVLGALKRPATKEESAYISQYVSQYPKDRHELERNAELSAKQNTPKIYEQIQGPISNQNLKDFVGDFDEFIANIKKESVRLGKLANIGAETTIAVDAELSAYFKNITGLIVKRGTDLIKVADAAKSSELSFSQARATQNALETFKPQFAKYEAAISDGFSMAADVLPLDVWGDRPGRMVNAPYGHSGVQPANLSRDPWASPTAMQQAQDLAEHIATGSKKFVLSVISKTKSYLSENFNTTLEPYNPNQLTSVRFRSSAQAATGRVASALQSGYRSLQGGEKAFLDIAPFGTGHAAKSGIQAIGGLSALNALGVGGMIGHAGGGIGATLGIEIGQGLTSYLLSHSPAIAQPVIGAIGSGITSLLGAGGGAAGAGFASLGAGATAFGVGELVASKSLSALTGDRKSISLAEYREDQLPILKSMFRNISGREKQLDAAIEKGSYELVRSLASQIESVIQKGIEQIESLKTNPAFSLEGDARKSLQGYLLNFSNARARILGRANNALKSLPPTPVNFQQKNDEFTGTTIDVSAELDELDVLNFQKISRGRRLKSLQVEQDLKTPSDSSGTEKELEILKKFLNSGKQALDDLTEKVKTFDDKFISAEKGINEYVGRANKSFEKQAGQIGKTGVAAEQAGRGFGSFADKIKTLAVASLSLFGFFTFGDAIKEFGRASIDASLQMDTLKRSLNISGSGQATTSIKNLKKLTDDLGISFQSAAEGYKGLSGATSGTALQGRPTDDIFRGISTAIAGQGLNREDSGSVFLAIQQIASKGTVSMEELRLQLAERLPNALNAAAESMGKTTPEFIRMVSAGDILSSELLPKLAAQLEAGSGIAGRADFAQASLNRLNNSLFGLQAAVGSNFLSAVGPAVEVAAEGIRFLSENFDALTAVVAALGYYGIVKLAAQFSSLLPVFGPLAQAIAGQITLNEALKLSYFDASVAAGTFKATLLGLVRIAWPIALIAGVTLITKKLDELNSAGEDIKSLNKSLDQTRQTFANLRKETEVASGTRNWFSSIKDSIDELFVYIGKKKEGFGSIAEGLANIISPVGVLGAKGLSAYGYGDQIAQDTATTEGAKTIAEYRKGLIETQAELDKLRKQQDFPAIRNLDKEIKKASAELSAFTLGGADPEVIKKQQEKVAALQSQYNTSYADIGKRKTAIDGTVASLEKYRNGIVNFDKSDPLYGIKQNELPAIESLLADWRAEQVKLNNDIASGAKNYEKINFQLDKAAIKTAQIAEANRRSSLQQQLRSINSAPVGAAGDRQLSVDNANRAVEDAKKELARLKENVQKVNNVTEGIDKADLENLNIQLKEYGQTFESITPETVEKIKGSSISDKIKGSLQKVLDQKAIAEKTQTDVLQAEIAVAEAQRGAKAAQDGAAQAIIDFNNSTAQQARDIQLNIENQRRAVQDSVDDLNNEIRKSMLELKQLRFQNNLKSKISGLASDSATQLSNGIVDLVSKLFEISNLEVERQNNKVLAARKVRDLDSQREQFGNQITQSQYGFNKSQSGEYGGVAVPGHKAFISSLGPITLPDVQNYGVSRSGGARRHAGQDYDISGNQNVYAGVSGTVTKTGFDPKGYGNYVDIFNNQLKVVERIAEAATLLVKVGDKISPGQLVARGESDTGVIHREIRTDFNGAGQGGYGFNGTVDPKEFYRKYAPKLFMGVPKDDHDHSTSSGLSKVVMTDTGTLTADGRKVFKVDVVDGNGNVTFSTGAYSGKAGAQKLETAAQGVPGSQKPIPEGRYSIGPYETGNFGKVGDRWMGVESLVGGNRSAFGFHADVDGIAGSEGCIVFTDPATVKRLADAVASSGAKDLFVDYGLGTIAKQARQTASANKPLGTMEASWYGPGFHGNPAADGSKFDQNAMTVAHKTLPFGTMLKIVGSEGEAIAKVTDRGPFIEGRDIDLSKAVAEKVGILKSGVGPVQVEIVGAGGAAQSSPAGVSLPQFNGQLGSIPYAEQTRLTQQQAGYQDQLNTEQQRAKSIEYTKAIQEQLFAAREARRSLQDFIKGSARDVEDFQNQLSPSGAVGAVIDQTVGLNRQFEDKLTELKRSKESNDRQIKTLQETVTARQDFLDSAKLTGATPAQQQQLQTVITDLKQNITLNTEASKSAEDAIVKLQATKDARFLKINRDLREAYLQNKQAVSDLLTQAQTLSDRLSGDSPEKAYTQTIRELASQFEQARLNAEKLIETLDADIVKITKKQAEADKNGDSDAVIAYAKALDELNKRKSEATKASESFTAAAEKEAIALEKQRFLRSQQSLLLNARADLLETAGYGYEAAGIRREDAIANQNQTYEAERKRLQSLADSGAKTREEVQGLIADLDELNAIKLEQINQQFKSMETDFRGVFKDATKGAFGEFFSKLRETGDFLKSLQETVLSFFDKIANKVFDVASNWFTNKIFGKAGKFGDKGGEGNLFDGSSLIQNLVGGVKGNPISDTLAGLTSVNNELFQLTNVLGGDGGVNGLFSTFGNLLGNLSGGGGLFGGGGGGGLGGLLGGLFSGGGGGLGSLDALSGGTDWGGILSSFGGLFYKGGTIPNYADGGIAELAQLGAAVAKSAHSERLMSGNTPILGMFNAGEAILNPSAVSALGGKYAIDKLNAGSYKIDTYAGGGTFQMDSAPSFPTPKLATAPTGSSTQSLEIKYVSDSSGTKFISQDEFEKAMAASEERSSAKGAAMVAERLQNSSSTRRAYGF